MTDPLSEFAQLDWSKMDNLIPVIVQDWPSLRVLMLGYFNQEALQKTLETGLVTFFSRSKQRLWQKGETSGNVLRVKTIKADCDNDTILILAEAAGPTCHLGTVSCFGDETAPSLSILADLAKVIRERKHSPKPGSYTSSLFAAGLSRMAQKVGEEGVEVALAGATASSSLADEAADLIYHLLVLLEASDSSLARVLKILGDRHAPADTAEYEIIKKLPDDVVIP